MRAIRYHGRGDIRLETMPMPTPGPGEVLLQHLYCGVCGSDTHEILHGPVAVPTQPHPLTGAQLPVVLGHEFCAVAVDTPDNPAQWRGRMVTVNPLVSCGHCEQCTAGAPNLCPQRTFIGIGGASGGLAEYSCVDAKRVHALPPGMAPTAAILTEPTAVVLHALAIAGPLEKRDALVVGGGTLGLLTAHLLKSQHGARVTLLERSAERRALASRVLGDAVEVRDAPAPDWAEGQRFDVAVDCAGTEGSFAACKRFLRDGGCVSIIGGMAIRLRYTEPGETIERGIRAVGALSYRGEFATAAANIDRLLPADLSWVETCSMDEFAADGVALLESARVIKPAVRLSDKSHV